MKLIIDINDNEYMGIKEYPNNITSYPVTIHIYDAVRKGKPIPDNATNGEVLKTMFMPNRITRTNDIVHIEYDFNPEWWNSPYQRGGKE